MNRTVPSALAIVLLASASSLLAQPFGRYARFDGSATAHFEATSTTAAQPTGALTFEAWVRITDLVPADQTTCRSLFGKSWTQSYWIGVCGTASVPVLRSYVSGYVSGDPNKARYDAGVLPLGTWTHIAVTADGSVRKHYVNGVLVGTHTPESAPTSSTSALQIGSDAGYGFRPWAEMDELRIWNVARTQAQILSTMNVPITSPQTGLMSVFPFEGSGEDIIGTADANPVGGAVPFASSQPFGGYVKFDGGTAYLQATSTTAAQPTGAATFEGWVRITDPVPSGGQECRSLFGKNYPTSYWIGYCGASSAPFLRSYVAGSSSLVDAGTLPLGIWTHIAVTTDGTTRKHYLGGMLAGSRSSAAPTSSTAPLQIGSDASWGYRPYAEMDELRIWNVARTQAQILSTMNAPIATAQAGLLSVFPFEGTGEDVIGTADATSAGGTVAFVAGTTSSRTFFVPVVLKNQYSSEITFTNRGSTTAVVVLSYTATSGSGSGTASSFTLAPGRQFIAADATELLRSLGLPLATSGTLLGTLRVTFTGLSAPDAGAVTVRTGTDTASPAGRAGLAYAGVPVERTFTDPVALAGLRFGAATVRTNLAIQNAGAASDGDVTLRVTVYNGDGSTRRVLADTTLTPGGFRQFSSDELGLTEGYFGSARVERVSAGGRFYAYAVQNDQTNSDGSFIPPVDPSTATGEALTVPSIVESGSYRTELFITNTGSTTRSMVATLTCPGCPPTAQYGFALEPHATTYLADVAAQMHVYFPSLPTPLGVAVFTVSNAGGGTEDVHDIVATTRTSSVVGSQGAFGVAYPALRGTQGAPASTWISAMQQNATTRSNLAFVNLGSAASSTIGLRLSIWNGDTGAQVAVVDDPRLAAIPPNGFVQINAFLPDLAPGVSNAYVKVTRVSGVNPFLAYGVVNDGGNPGDRTGDGAYVAMDVP